MSMYVYKVVDHSDSAPFYPTFPSHFFFILRLPYRIEVPRGSNKSPIANLNKP